MVDDSTFSSWRAIARIATILLTTGQVTWTVFIDKTLGLTTSLVWVAFESFGTEALRSMDSYATEGVCAASLEHTRALTLTVDASFVRWTVGISLASNYEYNNEVSIKCQ